MNLARLSSVLTVLNLVLLAYLVAQETQVAAQDIPSVLRGRALEIVDGQGRVRASITAYSDIVVFRLHDLQGKPMVKLDTHEAEFQGTKGSGLGLLGETDDTQAYIGTQGATTKVELKNRNGERQQLQP
jgi:hypothetical protein